MALLLLIFIIFIFGFVVYIIRKNKYKSNNLDSTLLKNNESKYNNSGVCSYCLSEIDPMARKCKYCGEWVQQLIENKNQHSSNDVGNITFSEYGVHIEPSTKSRMKTSTRAVLWILSILAVVIVWRMYVAETAEQRELDRQREWVRGQS